MKLEHVALSIPDPDEVRDFYHDILGMTEQKSSVLNKTLVGKIFAFDEEVPVFLMKKDNVVFELFVTSQKISHGCNHTCIASGDRETLLRMAEQKGYQCIRIERDTYDLIFVRDKNGNLFEIRESAGR